MKKSAALALALLLCTSSAYAYENSYAGYSVKEGDPFFKMESQRAFAYTNMDSKFVQNASNAKKGDNATTNIIKFYTPDEMEQVVGEKFTTAYFNAEYEKLALLKRSELNLQTVPTPLLDTERYAAVDGVAVSNFNLNKVLLRTAAEKIKPVYSVGIVAGHKAITTSYLYKQYDNLINVKESLISVNDRLYSLTSVYVDNEVYAKDKAKETASAKRLDAKNPLNIESVQEKEIPGKTLANMTKAHIALVKGLKTFAPQAEIKPVSYTDKNIAKTIVLPKDWFYSQFNMQLDKKNKLTITTSASLPEMVQVAEHFDYDKILQARQEDVQANKTAAPETVMLGTVNDPLIAGAAIGLEHVKLGNAYATEMKNIMPYWNNLLMTVSCTDDSGEMLREALAEPLKTKLALDGLLGDGLKRLQAFSANDDFISLTDYNYVLNCSQEKINVNVDTQLKFFNQYVMNGKLYLGCRENVASGTIFLKKAGFAPENLLEKQISEWQF